VYHSTSDANHALDLSIFYLNKSPMTINSLCDFDLGTEEIKKLNIAREFEIFRCDTQAIADFWSRLDCM
jgi:hypothetical protein